MNKIKERLFKCDLFTAIQHIMEIICNQQLKEWDFISTKAELHVNYTKERLELIPYLDKQLKKQSCFRTSRGKIIRQIESMFITYMYILNICEMP